MALPTSGRLSLTDIDLELNPGDYSGDGSLSLNLLSQSAGFSSPDAVSEFYGFSSVIDLVINIFKYSTNYSNDSIGMELIPYGDIVSPIYINAEIDLSYVYRRWDPFRRRYIYEYYDYVYANQWGPFQSSAGGYNFSAKTVFTNTSVAINFIRGVNYTFVEDPGGSGANYNVAQVNLF